MRVRYLLLAALLVATTIEITQETSRIQAQEDGASTAAVLMSMTGPVTVARADGTTEPGAFGIQLHAGDEVKTGDGAEAEIMFQAGNWVQIGANSSLTVQPPRTAAGEPEAAAEEKSFEVVQSFLKLKNSEGTSSLTGLRDVPAEEKLSAVSPFQTRVQSPQPTFQWKADDADTELRLTVNNETGVLWETDIAGVTEVSYPADAPALEPGVAYSWFVETTDPLVFPVLRTPAAFFEVLSPEEVDMLENALQAISESKPSKLTYHLMRASLFYDSGLLEDAIAETHTALATDPENESLHKILAQLYVDTGRHQDAIATYKKIAAE